MSDPRWGGTRPSRPYGREPGDRPHGRDFGTPGAPRTPPPGSRTPRRDPGARRILAGWIPAGWIPAGPIRAGPIGSGSIRAGPTRGGQILGGVTPAGAAVTPARHLRAVTAGIRVPPPGAAVIREPTHGPARCPPRGVSKGMGPSPGRRRRHRSARENEKQRGVPPGRTPGSTQPTRTRGATTQPHGLRDGAARGSGGRRDPPGGGISPPPRGLGRWGALQGGLGVCVIVACAAVGAIVTMVDADRTGSAARTVRRGRRGGRRAGRSAQGRPDDLPCSGALLHGRRPAQRGRVRPIRRFVQDRAGHRRGPVDRQRLLRDGARHRPGRRYHLRPLVPLAPRQAGHPRPGLAGPAGWPCPDRPYPG